ncbi:hypothetical protein F7725_005958 [Dissostichus mawsoni]|uniref:Thioredoxin domain-containing protein n=1 Tax=Dissostichus mawsoni TaxID=36200 RepID=A0A7J5YTW4_DISMA|nr:hypothetical protein F7725_005958 [Dissostichus mawsoni]
MLRRVRQSSLRQVLFLMARRPGLLCGAVLLGVLLVLAVKFTCSRAKNVVAAARPPVRFFSAEAPIVDLYLGQLDQVERLRSVAEVSLIFFYAPWCAHSMAARQEVQQVAKKLAKQVQFLAVNCWWNHGKCRKQNRFYQYPIIHLFYRRFGPIEYKGPYVAPYVESFILRVITPLTYLPSTDALKEFLSYHEPRVVGFFQFNSSLSAPGVHHVSVLCPAGPEKGRFNSSLIFPRRERNFTSEAICSWVFEHRETVLQWLQPPGTKSRLLEHELSKGPALLLFLPHNPLGTKPSPMLQQETFPPHSCCQSVPLPEFSASVCEVCLRLSPSSLSSSSVRCSFSSSTQGGEVFQSHLHHCCCLHRLPAASLNTSEGCSHFLSSYSPFSQYSACCREVEPQLNQSQAKEEQAAPLTHPSSPLAPSSQEGGGITGLRCHTNRTLRFYLLDVALNWPLAERLGATGNRSVSPHQGAGAQGDGSFATIVHLKDEVHYVLHRPAATLTESLGETWRVFQPYQMELQRSTQPPAETSGGRRGQESWGGETQHADTHQPPPRRLITELTTSSFLPAVMDVEKDVLLFYYTQWCGFCSILNHVIIELARLLQGNGSITVARVNVARNDLPWEFMVDHVPSILLFPKYSKPNSVKYPDDLPITLPNILHFLLQHSGSVQSADTPGSASHGAEGAEQSSLIRSEFLSLQREVQALRHARQRLSQQLAQLWRDNRRLTFDAITLEAQNSDLQTERRSLEDQHRETSRQLGEAVRRLEELVDASENLLNENTLLRVLLKALKDSTETEEQRGGEGRRGTEEKPHGILTITLQGRDAEERREGQGTQRGLK